MLSEKRRIVEKPTKLDQKKMTKVAVASYAPVYGRREGTYKKIVKVSTCTWVEFMSDRYEFRSNKRRLTT